MYGELEPIKTMQGGEVPGIPIFIQNPHKMAVVRLPTAEEISAYTATIRSVTNLMGRRQTEDRDVLDPKAERKLFEAVRLDKTGDEFDDAEIRYSIELLLKHRVGGSERVGDQYIVKVSTPWGVTSHTCRIPTTQEILSYRDGLSKTRTLRNNMLETRFPPEVPCYLYDSIIVAVEGYAPTFNVPTGTVNGNRHVLEGQELKALLPQIPPHHKRSVCGEVNGALYDLDPPLDPNG